MSTQVWAHRGASGYAPENTLEAFELAVKMGADAIELDVQMSRDGQLVVIHDEMVDRVSDASGWVKDYSLKELKAMNVNKKFPQYGTTKIPTLDQVYELVKPFGITVNVELKTGIWFYSGLEEAVVKLTEDMGMSDQVWYSSFNHYTVKKMKELRPGAKVGMLYEDGIYMAPEYAKTLGADGIHPAIYNLQYADVLEKCRELGLKVHVWTVNRKHEMKALVKKGVDAIITNYPDEAVKICRNGFEAVTVHSQA